MDNHTIRESQIVHTHGIGSISNFPGLSLMILAHDVHPNDWGRDPEDAGVPANNQKRYVEDLRLCDAFGVDKFCLPPTDLSSNSVKAVRFPGSMYCPTCGRIHFLKDLRTWRNGNVPWRRGIVNFDISNTPYVCIDCYDQSNGRNRKELIPMRFVIANEDGYIDDFPWDWYVHRNHREERRQGNKLYIEFKGSSASLGDIKIASKKPNGSIVTSVTLSEIFDQEKTFLKKDDEYLPYVENKMAAPWKGIVNDRYKSEIISDVPNPEDINRDEDGDLIQNTEQESLLRRKYPRTLQRGANNLYFPIVFKGIRLPLIAYDNTIPKKLRSLIEEIIEDRKGEIPEEYGIYTPNEWCDFFIRIIESLKRKTKLDISVDNIRLYFFPNPEEGDVDKKRKLRSQEYQCFLNIAIETDNELWYKARHIGNNFTDDSLELTNKIDQVVLLDKINELKVLRGFTRIRPLSFEEMIFEDEADMDGARLQEFQRMRDVRVDPSRIRELPCADVKGEGIFISFNDKCLEGWEQSDSVQARFGQMDENLTQYFEQFGIDSDQMPSARYVLLHTFSHLIMEQLAMDSGYTLSSLSEIIYCDNEGDMNGIMIYTSTSDAEGTLGGLVEKGGHENLQAIIAKAIDKAKWCSSDPLCIGSDGQGFMSTNMAACYACALLPETCCENMNKFLDRKLVLDFFDIQS